MLQRSALPGHFKTMTQHCLAAVAAKTDQSVWSDNFHFCIEPWPAALILFMVGFSWIRRCSRSHLKCFTALVTRPGCVRCWPLPGTGQIIILPAGPTKRTTSISSCRRVVHQSS